MAERSGIEHRYSCLRAGNLAAGEVDADGFYRRGAFPGTAARMALLRAARAATGAAGGRCAGPRRTSAARITHLVVASCTGFTAPGLDLQLAERLGLRAGRRAHAGRLHGLLGGGAGAARSRIRRCAPTRRARVLVVNLELCTLHLQETAGHRDGAVVPAVRRRRRGGAGDGRAARHRAARFPHAGDPRQPGPDHLAHRRPGLRHASVRQGARPHRRRRCATSCARTMPTGCCAARARRPSISGRCMPAAARCWTRWRRACDLAARALAPFARGAARLRQHVVGHGHVRAGAHAGASRAEPGSAGWRWRSARAWWPRRSASAWPD